MERFSWRYKPEFIVNARHNGKPASGMELVPAGSPAVSLADRGMLSRSQEGTLTCFGRQLWTGTDWIPAYTMTEPLALHFWIKIRAGAGDPLHIPGLFSDPDSRFGKSIFYANNLSSAGAIETKDLELIPDPDSINENKAALSTYTPAASLVAGAYTLLEAGRVGPGTEPGFSLSRTISDTQTMISLDLRPFRGAVLQVVLTGDSSAEEVVIPDEGALSAGVIGWVTIFKDRWIAPGKPTEYSINFIT